MYPHADILGQPESLGKPLIGSVALHAALFGTLLFWGVALTRHPETWGDANSGGQGSVAINVVNKIPLPQRTGIVNPLANPTESSVPTPPPAAKAQRRAAFWIATSDQRTAARSGTASASNREPSS